MDKVLALLQSLLSLNKVASVSVPGVLTAAGLAMILWPSRPLDEIPTVTFVSPAASQASQSNPVAPTNRATQPTRIPHPNRANIFTIPADRACEVIMKQLRTPQSVEDARSVAIEDQFLLDREKDKVQRCVEIETSRLGSEKLQNDNLALDIADLQKLLNTALDTYSSYEKTDNPIAARFRDKVTDLQDEILADRNLILKNEQTIRNRGQYLAELGRFDQIISARLSDPDRLRPRKTFDDAMAALVNHVVGFILLALALGVILTPLTQAASGAFFDELFPEGY
jgi:hypothetical protein